MMYGFQFLNQRPSDISPYLQIDSHDIGFPAKQKITDSVAYNSGEYDFSELYGSQPYGSRTVKYVIHVLNAQDLRPESMQELSTQLINWLSDSHGRQPLFDDTLPGYYFKGEVRNAASLADEIETGEMTVEFDCYAFKIRDVAEGQMDWDHFKLSSDIFQDIDFTVDGSLDFLLINPSATAVVSTVTVTGGPFATTINGASTTLKTGNNRLSLPQGECRFSVTGTGTLHFDWHREVI